MPDPQPPQDPRKAGEPILSGPEEGKTTMGNFRPTAGRRYNSYQAAGRKATTRLSMQRLEQQIKMREASYGKLDRDKIQKEHEERPWMTWRGAAMAVPNAGNNFARSMYEFLGVSVLGADPAREFGWKNNHFGDPRSTGEHLVTGFAQFAFGLGATKGGSHLLKKGVRAYRARGVAKGTHEYLKKKPTAGESANRWFSTFFEGAVHGGVSEFLAWDPREPNAFDALKDIARNWNDTSRSKALVDWMEEYLGQSKEGWDMDLTVEDQFKGRLKEVLGGVALGGGFNLAWRGVKLARLKHNHKSLAKKLHALDNTLNELQSSKKADPEVLQSTLVEYEKNLQEFYKVSDKLEATGTQLNSDVIAFDQKKNDSSLFTDPDLELKAPDLDVAKQNMEIMLDELGHPIPKKKVGGEAATQAPAPAPTPKHSLPMNFEFGKSGALPAGEGVKATSTFDAIVEGTRTATSRKDKSLDNVQVGDVVEIRDRKGRKILVEVTGKRPASTVTPEEWAKVEGYDAAAAKANWTKGHKFSDYDQITYKKLDDVEGAPEGAFKREGEPIDLLTPTDADLKDPKFGAEFEGKMVVTNGSHIWYDAKAIAKDYNEDGMAYMHGLKEDPYKRVYRASSQEGIIVDAMNLDVHKLKAVFDRLGGAEAYQAFLVKRHRNIIRMMKHKPVGWRPSPHNFEGLKLLQEATFDALTSKNMNVGMGIKPNSIKKLTGGLSRSPVEVPIDEIARAMFTKTSKGLKGGTGYDEFVTIMDEFNLSIKEQQKRILDGKEVLLLDDVMQRLTKKGIFNFNAGTGDVQSQRVIAALTTLFEGHLGSKKGVMSDPKTMAIAMGYKEGKKGQGLSPTQYLQELYGDNVNELAAAIGTTAEGLPKGTDNFQIIDGLIRRGGGALDDGHGTIKPLPDEVLKQSIHDLDFGSLKTLHLRVLAMRFRVSSRGTEIFHHAQMLSDAAKEGTDTTEMYATMMQNIHLQMQEIHSLSSAASTAGRTLRSFQNLERWQNMRGPDGKPILSAAEAEKVYEHYVTNAFGKQNTLNKSKENLRNVADLIITANRENAPEIAKRIRQAKLLTDSSLLAAGNELWINSMLSGLRTHSVNNISNLLKFGVGAAEKFLGAVVPLGITKGMRDSLKGMQIYTKENFIPDNMARKLIRAEAMRETMYFGSLMFDCMRMILRTTDEDAIVSKRGTGFMLPNQASDIVHASNEAEMARSGILTGAGHGAGHGGGTHFQDMRLGGASSENLGEAAQYAASMLPGGKSLSKVVGRYRASSLAGFMAKMWDPFLNSVWSQPIRKMIRSDEIFKQINSRALIFSRLAAEAKLPAPYGHGLTDNKEIAEFVHTYSEGLWKDGVGFSAARIRQDALVKAKELEVPPDSMDSFLEGYYNKHYHLRDAEGNIIMHGDRRADMMHDAITQANDNTFQNPLKQSAEESYPARLAARNEDPQGVQPPKDLKGFVYGNYANRLSEMAQEAPWMRAFVPFIRTPANLFRATGQRILPEFWQNVQHKYIADMNSGNPSKIYAAQARNVTGIIMLGTAFELSKKMTGNGPADPRERALWKARGFKAYNFIAPDGTQHDLSRFEPWSFPLMFAAEWRETYRHARNDKERKALSEDFMTAMVLAFGSSATDKSFLKGYSEMVELFNDALSTEGMEAGAVDRFFANRAGSITPNILEGFTGSIDQQKRELRGFWANIQAKVFPFGLPPERHPIFGEKLEKNQKWMAPIQHAFTAKKTSKPVKESWIEDEIAAIFAAIGPPATEFKNKSFMELTDFHVNFNDENPKIEKAKRKMAAALRAPGGAPCPLNEGQDVYDYWQEYMSKRTIQFSRRDFEDWLANAQKAGKGFTPDVRKNLEAWLKSMSNNKDITGRRVGLREFMTLATQDPYYKKLSHLPDQNVEMKSYRTQILASIVHQGRRESFAEMMGQMIDVKPDKGLKKGAVPGTPKNPVLGTRGMIAIFWPDLEHQYTSLYRNTWTWKGAAENQSPIHKEQRIKATNEKFGPPREQQ